MDEMRKSIINVIEEKIKALSEMNEDLDLTMASVRDLLYIKELLDTAVTIVSDCVTTGSIPFKEPE